MIVPVMAILNLVLTQQIYSEETNGTHAHYHEPVPLMFCTWFVTLWKSSFPWTPPSPRKLLPLNPPPPHRNFQWSSVAGVWIFSGTTHSSKNPHKRQYQVKKTIPANMYNHFHIKLASHWTRTGSTCTCILCYFSSYWVWDEKNTGKKMSIQYEIKQSSQSGTRPSSSFLAPTKWID